jgi:hypothetical protein
MVTRTGNKDGPLSTRPPMASPAAFVPETLAHPAGSSQKTLQLFPVRPEGGFRYHILQRVRRLLTRCSHRRCRRKSLWLDARHAPESVDDYKVVVALVGTIDLVFGEIDRRKPRLRPAKLLRDAVLPLVPVGDDILDERRGSRP